MGSYINASTDSTGNRGRTAASSPPTVAWTATTSASTPRFADAQSHRGAYIDSWYQYGAYNNSVDNDGLSASRYDSAAHAVSLETGYRYDIALSNRNTVSLTPQAQVTGSATAPTRLLTMAVPASAARTMIAGRRA